MARTAAKETALKWISARHLQHFIAQAETAGVNIEDLLDEAGVVRERLRDPDYPIPVSAIELMLASVTRQRDEPLLGLYMARNIQPAALGPLGYLAQTCATFADVLDVITRYSGLLSNIGRTSVLHIPGGAEVRWDCLAGGRLFRQQATEYVLGSFVVMGRLLIPGRQDLPVAVSLPHPRPASTDLAREYIAFFKCPVYFDRPYAAVTLPLRALQARLRHGDAFMKDLLERHAANLLRQRAAGSSLEDEVRHLIRALIADGAPAKETVAAQLGMSGRSLHRRLQESKHSYRELLDEVRLEIAMRDLRDSGDAIAEVAGRLGFSTHQAFLRWFKHSTGQTPGEYRHQKSGAS
jgi:AraC-like DNA-binding protein